MKLTVVIPTYRRPLALANCLAGLDGQELPPDEVVVVCRQEDEKTLELLGQWEKRQAPYRKKQVHVAKPGVIHAMSTGVAHASGEIVAFIDDDAVPWPDWIKRLKRYYEDPRVGGAGGRDVMTGTGHGGKKSVVGQITWYGRLIGNHDRGYGNAREVDVLKGVNMSFRKNLIAFPDFMKGSGAQVHFEVYVCMNIRKLNYKLIYDPQLRVNHYPAQRHDDDQRNRIVREAVFNSAFNLSTALLHGLSGYRRPVRIIYSVAIGDRRIPGLLRFLYGAARRDRGVVHSFLPAQKGLFHGMLYYFRHAARQGNAKLEAKGGGQT